MDVEILEGDVRRMVELHARQGRVIGREISVDADPTNVRIEIEHHPHERRLLQRRQRTT
jgi:hypothetical protein